MAIPQFPSSARNSHAQPSTSLAREKAKTFAFTRRRLDQLPVPAVRIYYRDTEVRGLVLAVQPSGQRSFYLYKWVNAKPERILLGHYPEISAEKARSLALKHKGQIEEGINPNEERRKLRAESTLIAAWKSYLDNHKGLRAKSLTNFHSLWNLYLSEWADRKISSITRPDVVALHRRIGREHPCQANRVVELLSAIYNRAIRDHGWQGINPATSVEPYTEIKRERFLESLELRAFFTSLSEEDDLIRDFFLVSLLTGARRSNVQSMRWDEISFERAIWTIPAAKAKSGAENGEGTMVILIPAIVKLLERRRENGSEWVFPGTGKTGHLVEVKTAWKRILRSAGLTDVRIHDLRRTLGSWQAAGGTSLPIIGKSLGHGPGSSATAVYARLALAPIRRSVEKATSAMLKAGGKHLLTE
jgi:integrase